nr:glycoside hydrolase family 2 protein [Luteimonas aquatica]
MRQAGGRRRGWSATVVLLVSAAWMAWAQAAPPASVPLRDGWEFRLATDDAAVAKQPQAARWHAARVPGNVHIDLLAAGLIRDPYVGAAEAELQWIGLSRWEYRTRFDAGAELRKRAHAALVFEGLDTFAEVFLNGERLASTDNSFRTWRIPVEGKLRARGNELTVVFDSPIRRLLPRVQAMPHKIAGNYPSPYGDEPKDAMTGNFARKPGYHYGWDWGPRYVTAGVWRPVRLEAWDALRLVDLQLVQQHLDAQRADLQARVQVDSDKAQKATLEIAVTGPDGAALAPIRQEVALQRGENRVDVAVQIPQPRRWWPAGYGEQALYTVQAQLVDRRGVQGAARKRTGLRTVELRREQDAQGGQGFAFVINGVPIFAKGANAIPFDAFPARVTDERLRRDLTAARDANMNMLRNWGGGYYESDAFFDIADELGLLVWQDFMFGGGMPPAFDAEFRANVVAEARDNVRRIRHHPSVVLWCGNNEEETAWKDWGHGKTLTEADPAFAKTVWEGYVQLFGRDLRQVVAEEGGGIPYWSSSPSNDLDEKANDSDRGDKHYWEVWGNPAKPPTAYLDVTPRFMSEYGLQAWPSLRTVDAFAEPGEQGIDAPVIRAHQKFLAGDGNQRLLLYIRREYGEPRDFPDFVYLSQQVQAEGIELAALHHRASRPRTMGSLYWQLNDVWPGASWSSLDYFGRWKPLHFHARRFFAPLAIAPLRKDGKTRVSLISDLTVPTEAEWRLRVLDFGGRLLREERKTVTLRPLGAQEEAVLGDKSLLRGADPRRTAAVFELWVQGRAVSRGTVYFRPAKELRWPAPNVRATLRPDGEGLALELRARSLMRGVWLDFGDRDVVPSDNALTLLPGEPVYLHLRTAETQQAVQRALRLRSLSGSPEPGWDASAQAAVSAATPSDTMPARGEGTP